MKSLLLVYIKGLLICGHILYAHFKMSSDIKHNTKTTNTLTHADNQIATPTPSPPQ